MSLVETLNLVDTDEAARRLGLSSNTLRRKRCEGTGPKFVRLGRNGAVRYRLEDLSDWLIEATSTSEGADAGTA